MRKISLVVLSLMLAHSATAYAQGMPGGMGGGGMGGGGMQGGGAPPESEPDTSSAPKAPAGPKPVKRERWDKIVTEMFKAADTNRDGIVTVAELHAIVEARRDEIIRARFARIDTNRDNQISLAEFIAWQKQMGSAASQDAAATGSGENGPIPDVIMPDAGKYQEDLVLAAMIEPLSGTVIARANTNYDAGVSLPELIAYEGKRFDAADTNHDGYLEYEEMTPHKPSGFGRPGMKMP